MDHLRVMKGHLARPKFDIDGLFFIHIRNLLPPRKDIVLSKSILMSQDSARMAAGYHLHATRLDIARR